MEHTDDIAAASSASTPHDSTPHATDDGEKTGKYNIE